MFWAIFTTSMIVCKHYDFINIDRHKYTHMKWNSCSWALRLHLSLSSIQYLIIMTPTIVFYSGSIEAPLFSLRNNRAEFWLIHRIGIVSINKIVSSHHDGLLMAYSKRSFICWAINKEGERDIMKKKELRDVLWEREAMWRPSESEIKYVNMSVRWFYTRDVQNSAKIQPLPLYNVHTTYIFSLLLNRVRNIVRN